MGAAASAGVDAAVASASPETLKATLNDLPKESKEKLLAALLKSQAGMQPTMYYWNISGRGELIRMTAAIGGVDLKVVNEIPSDKSSFGSPSGIPIFEHGPMKMSQSIPIAAYVSKLSPKFSNLTTQQRAKDTQFAAIKEDVLAGCAANIFTPEAQAAAPEKVPAHCDKWYPVIEGIVPSDGFINGLSYPTPADLAVLIMFKGYMPFGAAYKYGKYDPAEKYPKMKALVDRVAAVPEVKKYLDSSTSLTASMMGV